MNLSTFDISPDNFPGNPKKSGFINLKAFIQAAEAKTTKAQLSINTEWAMRFLRLSTDSLNTLSTRLTAIKKALVKLHGEQYRAQIWKEIFMKKSEMQRKISNDAKALTTRLKNKQVFKAADITKLLFKVRSSFNIYDQVILIQLSTGRRFIEVLSARYPIPEFKNKKLVFTELAKQDVKHAVNAPLFHIKYPELVKVWKAVREQIDQSLTNVEISDKLNGQYNKRLEMRLPGARSNVLRRLYAANAVKKKKRGADTALTINQALGHHPDNLTSQLNYKTSKIAGTIKTMPLRRKRAPKPSAAETRMFDIMKDMKQAGDKITYATVKKQKFGSKTLDKYYKLNLVKLYPPEDQEE